MQTVGQILKKTREENFYTLEQVEKATKIRKELLAALEADDYSKLPPPTFVQGFIKNYAKFLKLDDQKLLAVFRREFSQDRDNPQVLEAFSHPHQSKRFRITPGRLISLSVTLAIVAFFGYLWLQYHQYVGSPTLNLSSPTDQEVVDNPSITVEGKTDPESKVSVNNQDVPVSAQGNFKQEVKLSAPVNKITVIATSKLGQKTILERTVYVKR